MSTEIIDKTIKYKPKFKRFSIQGIQKKNDSYIFWKVRELYWGDIQYEPKKFCLPGGRRFPVLTAGGRLCWQAPLDSITLSPQYDTPSMWANMN